MTETYKFHTLGIDNTRFTLQGNESRCKFTLLREACFSYEDNLKLLGTEITQKILTKNEHEASVKEVLNVAFTHPRAVRSSAGDSEPPEADTHAAPSLTSH